MASLSASVLRRAAAMERLCKITGGTPFNAPPEKPNREATVRSEALLFELLADAFESVLQRLDKLESGKRSTQKEKG